MTACFLDLNAGWSNAEFWLRRQTTYDLVQVRKDQDRIHVQRYRPQPAVRGLP